MEETIAAIATAQGTAALAIIRMSGPQSHAILQGLCLRSAGEPLPNPLVSRTVYFCQAVYREELLDTVCVTYFKQPHTYTGLDCVEISCHGGRLVPQRILEALCCLGARLAEPGEFTRLRFLYGKMDLTQAEAVEDLISSKTEFAQRMAIRQLKGSLSERIGAIRTHLITLLAEIEAGIDFSDQDIPVITVARIQKESQSALQEIKDLLERSFSHHQLHRGIKVGIIGRPNTGKSSLFNALVAAEKAIVTPHPGTTRDVIEAEIVIHGFPFIVHDTAGLRDSADAIEAEGIRRTQQCMESADLLIYVLDASQALDHALIQEIEHIQKDTPIIFILNKSDLAVQITPDLFSEHIPAGQAVLVSSSEGTGIEAVADELFQATQQPDTDDTAMVMTNLRHRSLLQQAAVSLAHVRVSADQNQPLDILAVDLHAAVDSVSQITGDTVTEDMLDQIFQHFCLGK